MLSGMLLIAISDLGTALATSVVPLVVARLGLGAGRCLSESGERGYVSGLTKTVPELRGRSNAAQQAVLALGVALGAPIGGAIVEMYGARASFLCVTTAALLSLIIYTFLPKTKSNISTIYDQNDKQRESIEQIVSWKDLLQDPQWQALSIFEIGAKFGYEAFCLRPALAD